MNGSIKGLVSHLYSVVSPNIMVAFIAAQGHRSHVCAEEKRIAQCDRHTEKGVS